MRYAILALAAVAGMATPALGHPGGHDEFEPQRRPIAEIARDAVVRLVTQARLPATWARASVVGTEYRTRNGQEQFVVTFRNGAERNRARQTLYVLMTPSGQFISANYRLT